MSTPAPSASQPIEATPTPLEPLLVNLQVVSPSLSVNRPLLFPDLPATTTIKGLKEKIRQTLPLRPADDNQRLIHRGRALLRESDTLLDVFGPDALRTLDRQTIHLVIRDMPDGQTSTPPPTTARGPSPAEATGPARPSNPPHLQFGPEPPPGFPRRGHFQASAHHIAQPRVPSPAPAHYNSEQAATFQQHHQNMSNWLGQVQRDAQLQREAMVRALVNQNQRGRAQVGMRGIGDTAGNNGPEAHSGRVSPGTSHAIHYETMGPNGQTYQVDTVVRSSTQGAPGGLSPAEVQNIIRSADSNQAAMVMANALQRNVPGASLYNRPLTQPGVTTPILGAGSSLAGSGRATPELDPRSAGAGNPAPRANSPRQPQQGPQIYLLLSPDGPRALLFNSTTAETYYSPRLRGQASWPRLRSPASQSNLSYPAQPSEAHAAFQQDERPQQDQRPQPRDDAAAAVPAHVQPPLQPAHPNNPAAAAGLPPILVQFWPHLWLIFRLGLFVWFFTSPNSSWSRWLTIICLAVFMFVLSTGLLNGLAENAWRPIGRHLENILPALEPPRITRAAGTGRVAGAGQGGHDSEADPEQLAARLFRRLERAGLLFLASLAPGVAERHIANLEAEARAEETAAADSAGGEAESNRVGANGTEHGPEEEQRSEHAGHEAPQANAGNEPNREEVVAL
ncbi:Ubiquitin family protein [Hirsutella rhossiliensis]|uniref:Ubiquitin family protein n=1 Tax=Hirsutella rhossiliensis TaxID=111463 RepID=A0A9P8N1U8_9HYPO|nr:Ubiquitin family protein [Hirsutella rhossiliensis]KAH0964391.1 Ubiquitin family protein [Hirsutella rhossiliensis]